MLDTNGAVNKILEIVDDSSVEQILNDIVELVDSTNQKLDDANALLNSIKQNSDYSSSSIINSVTITAGVNSGNQQILGVDVDRKTVMIYNNTNRNVYISIGQNANTTNSFSLLLSQNSVYEAPVKISKLNFNVSITQATATGTLIITTTK